MNAASQVAAAKPAASTPAPAEQTNQKQAEQQKETVPNAQPVTATDTYRPGSHVQLKGRVGFSWNSLLNKDKAQATLSAAEPSNTPSKVTDEKFTQQDLELQWMLMCNRMPQRLNGVATRMKNMTPSITEFPAIEVVADNQLAMEQMTAIKGSIVNTLKRDLNNQAITLTIRVAEHHDATPVLSRREQYETMEKENPSIAKLRELLSLELA